VFSRVLLLLLFLKKPFSAGLIFGTTSGEVVAVDLRNIEYNETGVPLPRKKSVGTFGRMESDTILGLCWLRPPANDSTSLTGYSSNHSNLFFCGSSMGRICLGDVSKEYDNPTAISSTPQNPHVVQSYDSFERLTSIHVNSTNAAVLVSGYATGIALLDVETAKTFCKVDRIHTDNINISRFCNYTPHLFATSSFDGCIKTWDMRAPMALSACKPIYTAKCNSGIVMINFSNDDNFVLASALDNEINQFHFADGRKHLTYNIPKTNLKGNFTRAYYTASGRYALTGACEESNVKVMCAYTGEPHASIELYPGKKDKSLYIQVR
jgi:WD40 repeat protein